MDFVPLSSVECQSHVDDAFIVSVKPVGRVVVLEVNGFME
jgi:hypothetical protein